MARICVHKGDNWVSPTHTLQWADSVDKVWILAFCSIVWESKNRSRSSAVYLEPLQLLISVCRCTVALLLRSTIASPLVPLTANLNCRSNGISECAGHSESSVTQQIWLTVLHRLSSQSQICRTSCIIRIADFSLSKSRNYLAERYAISSLTTCLHTHLAQDQSLKTWKLASWGFPPSPFIFPISQGHALKATTTSCSALKTTKSPAFCSYSKSRVLLRMQHSQQRQKSTDCKKDFFLSWNTTTEMWAYLGRGNPIVSTLIRLISHIHPVKEETIRLQLVREWPSNWERSKDDEG